MSRLSEPYYFEVYKDRKGGWHWRYMSHNGNNMARSSEGNGYKSKGNCLRSISNLRHRFISWYGTREV